MIRTSSTILALALGGRAINLKESAQDTAIINLLETVTGATRPNRFAQATTTTRASASAADS